MRLVDKDVLEDAVQGAINVMESHGISMTAASVPLAIIKGALTIDAIPVEWLQEKANGNDFVTGRAARLMLHAWEQENNPSPTCGPDYCEID